jgi:hypothetical protein
LPQMVADTSSPAAASTCVVEPAAAAFAALIADPIPVKSLDAAAKSCGATITKEDICGLSHHQAVNSTKQSLGTVRRYYLRVIALMVNFAGFNLIFMPTLRTGQAPLAGLCPTVC